MEASELQLSDIVMFLQSRYKLRSGSVIMRNHTVKTWVTEELPKGTSKGQPLATRNVDDVG